MLTKQVLQECSVLVIDDDPKSLQIMRELIGFYGANIHTAENGLQGLEKARTTSLDFIITDISMPIMDGWEMITTLKMDRTTAEIPIIALTAHAMVGDREKAIAAGCHNYLTKPLRPQTFLDQLLNLLMDIPKLSDKIKN